jgi:S-adenosylmethionine:tRNA ribosyltransferase-isomerase
LKSSDYNFRVPERLIPYTPPELRGERRDHARMVVLHRTSKKVDHVRFDVLGSYLNPGDVLVVNNTMMVHDQLRGITSRGPIKILLFGHHADGWHVSVSPVSRAARGLVVRIGGNQMRAVLVKETVEGLWLAKFECEGDFYDLLAKFGERNMPLYRPLKEQVETYHNVYATEPGSLEIPSAGLHFTRELLDELEGEGVLVVPITLHIGLTELQKYRHIIEENVEDHRVGSEWYRVSRSAAAIINRARRTGTRVVAVGTSVVRALETVSKKTRYGTTVQASEGWTDLYIYPGYEYRIVDAMLTNLHEPQSSHLLLVAAFAGKRFTLDTYRQLIRERYRFDLFGDSMMIL